jgi:hypothetical protein
MVGLAHPKLLHVALIRAAEHLAALIKDALLDIDVPT